jgi:hypothetical protein
MGITGDGCEDLTMEMTNQKPLWVAAVQQIVIIVAVFGFFKFLDLISLEGQGHAKEV